MQEARDRHPGPPHLEVRRRPEISAAHAVDQYSDLDFTAMRTYQRFDEGNSGGVSAEDIARQSDTFLGGVDAGNHARVGFVAVAQDEDGIAIFGGSAGDALRRIFKRCQVVLAAVVYGDGNRWRGGSRGARGERRG